jgi:hypothetical protein
MASVFPQRAVQWGWAAGTQPISPGEKAIIEALQSPAALEFVDTPLKDVIDFLQDKYKIPILLDKKELESSCIGEDCPVTTNLKDIPLSSALTLVLGDLGVEWTVSCDVLLITTPEKAAQLRMVRTYDVSDLLGEMFDHKHAAAGAPADEHGMASLPGLAGPGMGLGGMMFKPAKNSLVELLTTTLAPESWQDDGGPGTIVLLDRAIVVSQTWKVHQQIAALLADLRAARQAMPTLAIDLHWLWLSAAEQEELLAQPPEGKGSTAGRTALALNAQTIARLAGKAPGFRSHVACSNGQWVHLASGERRTPAVRAVSPAGGGVEHAAPPNVPNSGVHVQLRPAVAPGGDSAVLDIEYTVMRQGKPRPAAGASAAGASSPALATEQQDVPTAHLATTVRVPLGQPVLLGGMTFAAAGPAALDEAGKDSAQLCLIATTRVAADRTSGEPAH